MKPCSGLVSGAAVCDATFPEPVRKQQFSEAAAHIPPTRLLPFLLLSPREHPVQLSTKPVCLPGLRCPGLRVPGRGPDAGWLVPTQQTGWSLPFSGPAAEKRERNPWGVCSRTVQHPTAAAGSAAFSLLHRCLPEKTQPVSPLPVRGSSSAPQKSTNSRPVKPLFFFFTLSDSYVPEWVCFSHDSFSFKSIPLFISQHTDDNRVFSWKL